MSSVLLLQHTIRNAELPNTTRVLGNWFHPCSYSIKRQVSHNHKATDIICGSVSNLWKGEKYVMCICDLKPCSILWMKRGDSDVFLSFRMKCVMIFLVLTLVVLMAEPGESLFGRLRAFWRGGRPGYKSKYKLKVVSLDLNASNFSQFKRSFC